MTTVFLSGSRKIGRLNDMVRDRLQNMIDQNFRIIVGDANGADKALQEFFAEAQYNNVLLFCAGSDCRNNVGNWDVKNVQVDPMLKGRDFYAQKDKKMASEADYGFVLWDGRSAGSISNVIQLLKRQRRIVVYLWPEKKFFNVTVPQDAHELLRYCNSADYSNIDRKIGLSKHLDDLNLSPQETLL